MGIKSLKEKYKIEHLVQNRNDTICIGSVYAGDIIVIDFNGKIIKKYKDGKYNDGWSTNEDLKRYQEEMTVDEQNGDLKKVIDCKDVFIDLKPIFTVEDGKLIETFCEKYDYPNTTIEGLLIYENTFFKTKKEAVAYGLDESLGHIKMLEERKVELEEQIFRNQERINKILDNIVVLESLL